MSMGETMEKQAEEFRARYTAVQEQIGRVIVGHEEIVHGVLAMVSHSGEQLDPPSIGCQ